MGGGVRARRRVAGAVAACLALATGAVAQTPLPRVPPLPPAVPEQERRAPETPPLPTSAPFDAPLDRLAELMGTLAFMRDLCGDGDGPAWRDKLQALIDAEGRTGARVERLAGSFNRGFQSYQLVYRTCTPAAQVVIDRALDEGSRIAKELSVRFADD